MDPAAEASDTFEFGPFLLAVRDRLLLKQGAPVTLGGRALDILIALVERAGDVVSHGALAKRVWPDVIVEESSLRVHVAALRRALDDGSDAPRYIANVRGRGYCFVAPVQRRSAGQPPARGSDTRTLPVRLQPIIGREAALDALRGKIAAHRLVTIVGPGGVGKTTVAVAVARCLATEFQDAVCFVDLSAHRDGALVVSAVATAVGCTEPSQDPLQTLLAFLARKRILLVLDNCEHVVSVVAPLAARLVREAPFLHLLGTSREALRTEEEVVYLLEPLGLPASGGPLTATEILASPAVRLFVDRAKAGGYRPAIADADAPVLADICRHLDGIPLAIELAASRAAAHGIGGLAELVGARLMLTWQGRRSRSRHQTLATMLDWSYDLLSESEKSVFCCLSVFVGSFTLAMAQAVAAGTSGDDIEVLTALESLVGKSLVAVTPLADTVSYRLLETTRAHGIARLRQRGNADAVARRHALLFSARLAGLRFDRLKERDLADHGHHLDDIRAALQWSFSESGDARLGVALAAGAVPLLAGLSMLAECRRWCLQALNVLSEPDRGTALEASLQLALAIASHHGYTDSAEPLGALERGLAIADGLGDMGYQLEFLAGLNLYWTRSGDTDAQLAAAERYVAIARGLNRPREIVAGAWMLAASHHLAGNQALAHRHYGAGFSLSTAADMKEVRTFGYDHTVRALIGYARTLWLHGLPDQAARYAFEGIEVAERQAHPVSLAIALVFAGPVFLWRGDLTIAGDVTARLAEHSARYGLAQYHAGSQALQGELLLARGDIQPAVALLRTALPILQAHRRFIFYATCARALAEGLARLGDIAAASVVIQSVLDEAPRGAGLYERPELLRTQAEIMMASPGANSANAGSLLERSIALARQQSARGWELRSALLLARLWAGLGRAPDARDLLAGVASQFTEGVDTADLRRAASLLREWGEGHGRE